MDSQENGGDIQSILASWRKPGQVYFLGASALHGTVKAAEARARRLYYSYSFLICAGVFAFLVIVSILGS